MRAILLAVVFIAGCSGGKHTAGVCGALEGDTGDPRAIYNSGTLQRSIGGIYTASWSSPLVNLDQTGPLWEQAVAPWERLGLEFVLGAEGGITFKGVDESRDDLCAYAIIYARQTNITACEIYTTPLTTNTAICGGVAETMTHEIGHCLGILGHTNDGGLMDPTGGNGEISEGVANAIRELYEC